MSAYVFTHHIALMHLWVHGELHHEPGGISQDKCRNQVPVDDISQTPDTPENGGEGKIEEVKDGRTERVKMLDEKHSSYQGFLLSFSQGVNAFTARLHVVLLVDPLCC